MKWQSLRLRLVAGGLVAILIALAIAGGSFVLLFERHLARTLAADLDVHLNQLLAGIDLDPKGNLMLTQSPSDPRFANPLSGLYWQISDSRGQLLRSRSLWDTTINLPADKLAPGEVHQHDVIGPAGRPVLVAERTVGVIVADQRMPVRVVVGTDSARLSAAASAFAKDLALALGLLGCVLAIATSVQVALGLRPLEALRRGVADIRAGRRRHLPGAVPTEVEPLVEEVNALVDLQTEEIERSRSRAADLAHGLKTPLAALTADAARLHEGGEHVIARNIEEVAEAMSRHVDRELARARARGRVLRGTDVSTELKPLVDSLVATLARTPAGKRIRFEAAIVENQRLPIDRTDLAEVLGNLLENATRHAVGLVRITAEHDMANSITIEDDGKGLSPADMPCLLERGARLDERGEGAGLGLAIVQDVLDAYEWQLDLTRSTLGGLRAAIAPKVGPNRQPVSAKAVSPTA